MKLGKSRGGQTFGPVRQGRGMWIDCGRYEQSCKGLSQSKGLVWRLWTLMMCLAWKGERILHHPPIFVHHLRLGWRSNHSWVENNQLQYRAVGFRWQRRGKGGEGTRIGRGQASAYLQIGEISKLCPLKVKSCVGAQSLRKSCIESSLMLSGQETFLEDIHGQMCNWGLT